MLKFDPRSKLPSLLLVDDDLVSREVTATLLTMSGYSVLAADSGEAALALLGRGEAAPDVILMDAQMPGLSGVALIASFRQRSPADVYVISASVPPADVAAAADATLLKPFCAEQLARLLDTRRPAAPDRNHDLLEPSVPVICVETLAQLRVMMPPRAVREVFTAVLDDLHKRAQLIDAAIVRRDLAEVRRLGHAIKGGCGMAGALEAARIGAMIENLPALSEGNQLDNGRALLGQLRAATEKLERMLESEFSV
jgi:CheY-like chemotaxis protein